MPGAAQGAAGKPATFSPTQMRLLAGCEAAYAARYVRHLPVVREDSAAAATGTLVHLALEAAAQARLRSAIPRVQQATGEELAGYLASRGQEREVPDVPGAAAAARAILEAAAPSVHLAHVHSVEQAVRLAFGGVAVGGRWDRVDVLPDGRVRVVDYKSGFVIMSREEAETDPQTVVYMRAAADQFPFAPAIDVEYHYLRADVRVCVRARPELLRYAEELARHVDATYDRCAATDDWPARVSARCATCEYRGTCSDYATALAGHGMVALDTAALDTAALVEERQRMSALAALAEARRKELDAALRPRVADARGELLTAGGWRARIASRRRRSYPDAGRLVAQLTAATGEHAGDVARAVLDVGVAAVDRWIAALPDEQRAAAEEAAAAECLEDAGTYLDVRRVKGGF